MGLSPFKVSLQSSGSFGLPALVEKACLLNLSWMNWFAILEQQVQKEEGAPRLECRQHPGAGIPLSKVDTQGQFS